MTPDQYERAQSLFLQWRELSAEEQQTRLTTMEETDLEVGRLVQQLLEADRTSTGFLESMAPNPPNDTATFRPNSRNPTSNSPSSPPTDELAPPKVLGPYRILQQIGEGGHGVVFMAEQTEPVRRKVALKWIKPGMASKQILARFDAERQALAMMNHPSIANVFDAATSDSGQPYFVMELVHGVPIDQFCKDNGLDLQERLKLFTQVCDAVHHAHRKGIIHRDIKPGNVLVTVESGKPLAKVIDFGIAKALNTSLAEPTQLTDQTLFTQYGQIVGTLEYMSPEQAVMSQKGADVRSDVYSLGVLLYLLLTGSTPISRQELLKEGIWEFKNVLRDYRPATPSLRTTGQANALRWRDSTESNPHETPPAWQRLLKGDLDWITMTALAKEPEQRYDSAAALAQDLDHYLQGQPVLARPPSHWYRFKKFIQRNRVSTFVASTVAFSLLAALVAFGFSYYQIQSNLKIIQQANRQVNAYATRMAKTNRRTLLEQAWNSAANGDAAAASGHLNDVPEEYRDFAWEFVRAVQQQTDWASLESPGASAIRVASTDVNQSRLAILRSNSMLEIWDLVHRQRIQEIRLPRRIYSIVRFSEDGNVLLIGGSNDLIQLVDLVNERVVGEAQPTRKGGIRDAIHDAKRDRWLICSGANYVFAVNDEDLQLEAQLQLPQRLTSIIRSPDGKHIVVATKQGPLFLLPPDLGQSRRIKGASSQVVDWHWTDDGLHLVSFLGEVLWLPKTSLAQPTASSIPPSAIKLSADPLHQTIEDADQATAIAFDGQSNLLLGDRLGRIKLIEANGDESIPLRQFGSAIESIFCCAKTGEIVIVHRNSRVNLISGPDVACRRAYVRGLRNIADSVPLGSERKTVTGQNDGVIKIWDTVTGKLLRERAIHSSEILSVTVHEASQTIASHGTDWSVRLTDLESLEPRWDYDAALGVRSIRISRDGNLLAAAPKRLPTERTPGEGVIDLIDLDSHETLHRLQGHANWVIQMEFSDQDQTLVTYSVDGTARVWSTESGKQLAVIDHSQAPNVNTMCVLNGRNGIAFGHADGSISIWNSADASQKLRRSLFGDGVGTLLSPAGSNCLIASANNDTAITLLDMDSLELIGRLEIGIGYIKDMRMDSNHRRLQIYGDQQAVRIWDLPTQPGESSQ